jgi:SIR2-like domain
MIFTDDDIDLPERLLESLTNGQLVVFVGAGVSMQAYKEQPLDTWYPGFKELARIIAQRLNRSITETEERHLDNGYVDRILGGWDDEKCDVRRHAAIILQANETGQRLDLHRAIIRLFSDTPTARIITTNFDRLLIRALEAEGLTRGDQWNISIAPALPPVRRFRGICYLHGCVDEPQDMVLTDKDIGRAYMDEGWALRFAHSIFQQFNILFIGYSLQDPPLRYLSLALEGTAGQGRWALVPDRDPDATSKAETERDWERRHVKPIWYSAKDDDYRGLERTVDAWGGDNSRSFLDRRNVLVDIGKSKPDHLKPHELNRAKFFLQDSPQLRDFAKASLDIEWFDMLFSWGHFDFLIKGSGKWSEADGILAERFVVWVISNPVEILGKVSEHMATLNTVLFDQFCRSYQEGKATAVDVQFLRRILEFFRPAIEQNPFVFASMFIKRILSDLLDGGYEEDSFWLLGIALRTRSVIAKSINFAYQSKKFEGKSTESIPEYELRYELQFETQITEHNVKELLKEVFLPRSAVIGFRFVHFLTMKFLELRAIDSRGKERDLGSHFIRPAIEPHSQNFRDDPVNFLLDVLRDSWEALLKANPAQAEGVYWFWQRLKDELIERLRIHALTKMVEDKS